MTDTENKQELVESLPSLPVVADSELQLVSTTEPEEPIPTAITTEKIKQEANTKQEADSTATLSLEQDEFSDAIDDSNIKSAQDLSSVISALQDTVIVSLPDEKQVQYDKNTKLEEEQDDTVLDTIPEINEFGSSLIKEEEDQEDPITNEEEEEVKADIDISLNDDNDDEGIKAASEPGSPRPTASDLKIATHFEQIRKSIDVPTGQNMADFVTPPTPGLAPDSFGQYEGDDNDDDLHPQKKSNEETNATTVATAAAGVAVTAVAASQPKPAADSSHIALSNIDFDEVRPNFLTPRAQEKFGK
jgi:hypothetical protein